MWITLNIRKYFLNFIATYARLWCSPIWRARDTSYLPAGRGAPKAWKDWGNGGGAISGFSKRFQRKNISSVVTVTCYSGCLSATTPLPTPQLGAPAAHSARFPTSIHPMGPCSFDFSKFYRVGCEINEHQPLQ